MNSLTIRAARDTTDGSLAGGTRMGCFGVLLSAGLLTFASSLAHAAPLSQEPNRVLYQVYVESFRDGTIGQGPKAAGSGNFDGLRDSLTYLKDLGVTGLLVMPIFESDGMGYIPDDFFSVRRSYALASTEQEREQDFKRFADAAHQAGIKIFLDSPINHISRSSTWFQNSVKRIPGFANWFLWSPQPLAGWHRPWQGTGKPTDVWHLDPTRGEYYYALFSADMPDLNHRDPDVIETFHEFFAHYAALGADGFRIDAAKHLVEGQDNLNPTLPENLARLKDYLQTLRTKYPDQSFINEIWSGYEDIDPYLPDTADLALDFPYMERLRDTMNGNHPYGVRLSLQHFEQTQEKIPAGSRVVFMGNHDLARIRTAMQDDQQRVEVGAALTFSLPQIPMMYYGDEIFMPGTYLRDENGWTKTNEVCSPMAWSTQPNAGFTDPEIQLGDSWNRKLHPDWKVTNVEVQSRKSESLLNFVKQLIAARKTLPIDSKTHIRLGNQDKSDPILTVAMTFSDGSCSVALYNFTNQTQYNRQLSMPGVCEQTSKARVLLNRRALMATGSAGVRNADVAPRGVVWVQYR